MIHKILYEDPPEVTALNPGAPPGLGLVVSRAMAKEGDERYASASEFLDEIRNFNNLQPRESRPYGKKTYAENQEAYERAEQRVKSKLLFYRHLEFFLGVNFLLLLLNLLTSHRYFWFKWPLLVLSVPLFFHWLIVFGFSRKTSIRERLLEKEMNEEVSKRR
jgi:hypothetical protein